MVKPLDVMSIILLNTKMFKAECKERAWLSNILATMLQSWEEGSSKGKIDTNKCNNEFESTWKNNPGTISLPLGHLPEYKLQGHACVPLHPFDEKEDILELLPCEAKFYFIIIVCEPTFFKLCKQYTIFIFLPLKTSNDQKDFKHNITCNNSFINFTWC